jgi:hypothetical protein
MSLSKIEQMAARLNGRQYLEEMTPAEAREAKQQGLLVVFGASDDLAEFRGAFFSEEGAWEGRKFSLGANGIVTEQPDHDDLIDLGWTPPRIVATVSVEWCPEGFEGSWRITPDCPFAPFDIMEDGQLFCRGAVIDWETLTKGTA